MKKPTIKLQPCSKEFPNMKHGHFAPHEEVRMICDFHPRAKILKTLLDDIGGKHSSGCCEGHFQIMSQWMQDKIDVVFADGTVLRSGGEETKEIERVVVDDRCRRWKIVDGEVVEL